MLAPADGVVAATVDGLQDVDAGVFDRKVDLITEGVIKNPYRLRSIEADKVLLYAA